MTSDVLYGRSRLAPYFNMERFEDRIYNRAAIREKRIKGYKILRFFDRVLVLAVIIAFSILVSFASLVVYQHFKTYTKINESQKLKNTLREIRNDYNNQLNLLKQEIKLDDLKMKAYIELNMITPTENSIIHFDKTDSGFVRQYENIR